MANYCPNCGQTVSSGDRFCASCGTQLVGGTTNNNTNYAATNTTSGTSNGVSSGLGTAAGILGTLVTVSLIGGLTRQLYYYGGRYFLDPYCRRPYMSPHLICGRPPMGPMGGPMGGPRGGGFGGPMGGPHGGPGGPGGGGPRGGGHR
jgi:hypothetical protein